MKKIIFVSTVIIAIFAVIGILVYNNSDKSDSHSSRQLIIASIPPIKYIVDEITGKSIDVEVLLPDGASPETYELTAKQMNDMTSANAVLTTGLIDFETSLVGKLTTNHIISLSVGVNLIEGHCSHNHNHSHHGHGTDPHIWTSPKQLRIMAENAYDALSLLYPDSTNFSTNYKQLQDKINDLDQYVAAKIKSSGRKSFLIYHPAMTYYSADYGIEQISIEDDGKEPSATHLKNIITRAKTEGLTKILYQAQFSASTTKTIAKDINGESVIINPLDEDIIANTIKITDIITE